MPPSVEQDEEEKKHDDHPCETQGDIQSPKDDQPVNEDIQEVS